MYELIVDLLVGRKEYCWFVNEFLRSIRNLLVRIWWLNLSMVCWGELVSYVCWDLVFCERIYWRENIFRGRVGSRGRGSLINIIFC